MKEGPLNSFLKNILSVDKKKDFHIEHFIVFRKAKPLNLGSNLSVNKQVEQNSRSECSSFSSCFLFVSHAGGSQFFFSVFNISAVKHRRLAQRRLFTRVCFFVVQIK